MAIQGYITCRILQGRKLETPGPARRAKLLASHCFECDCSRCADDSGHSLDARISGFACERGGSGGSCGDASAVVPLETAVCSGCGGKHSLGVAGLQQLYLKSVGRLQEGEAAYKCRDYRASRTVFESILSEFTPTNTQAQGQGRQNLLYRSHVVVYSSLHHLTSLCSALNDPTW